MEGQIIRPFGPTLYRNKFSQRMRLEVIEKSVVSADDAPPNLAGNIVKENFIEFSQESAAELTDIIQDYVQRCAKIGV